MSSQRLRAFHEFLDSCTSLTPTLEAISLTGLNVKCDADGNVTVARADGTELVFAPAEAFASTAVVVNAGGGVCVIPTTNGRDAMILNVRNMQ